MFLPITALFAGFFALFILYLIVHVIRTRLRQKIVFGDGGDPIMIRAMRGHANAIEIIPLGLILLGLLETSSVAAIYIWILGGMLALGRIFHAWYFTRKGTHFRLRQLGMILTLLFFLASGGLLISLSLAALV